MVLPFATAAALLMLLVAWIWAVSRAALGPRKTWAIFVFLVPLIGLGAYRFAHPQRARGPFRLMLGGLLLWIAVYPASFAPLDLRVESLRAELAQAGPDATLVRYRLGSLLRRMGRPAEAAVELEQALRATRAASRSAAPERARILGENTDWLIRTELTAAYQSMKQYERIVTHFQDLENTRPLDRFETSRLATAYRDLGQTEQAIAALERSCRLGYYYSCFRAWRMQQGIAKVSSQAAHASTELPGTLAFLSVFGLGLLLLALDRLFVSGRDQYDPAGIPAGLVRLTPWLAGFAMLVNGYLMLLALSGPGPQSLLPFFLYPLFLFVLLRPFLALRVQTFRALVLGGAAPGLLYLRSVAVTRGWPEEWSLYASGAYGVVLLAFALRDLLSANK